MQAVKNTIRKLLFSAGLDFTKNQKYDRQTLAIMKKVLKVDSNCIDVGCHKGEVMDEILKISPKGKHIGFEPIPEYFEFLQRKYRTNSRVSIFKKALSNSNGETEFNWVKNAPAYSGIKERSYAIKNPQIEKIRVELVKLDDYITEFPSVGLIKIDVEGAELMVLQGARNFIQRHKPVVIFEFGLGAADHYGVKPDDIYEYFSGLNYQLFTLKGYLESLKGLEQNIFDSIYHSNTEYYFVAVAHI
jgi:FkbM family methyltransferase